MMLIGNQFMQRYSTQASGRRKETMTGLKSLASEQKK
jgi:hypothetical protein